MQGSYDDNFQNAVCRHLDKLANPEVPTTHGTLEGIKRLEEIWVFGACGFDAPPVAHCPGILGGGNWPSDLKPLTRNCGSYPNASEFRMPSPTSFDFLLPLYLGGD